MTNSLRHEHWNKDEWAFDPATPEPMKMPEDYEFTEPTKGPETRTPLAELLLGPGTPLSDLYNKIIGGMVDSIRDIPTPDFDLIRQELQQRELNLFMRIVNGIADAIDGIDTSGYERVKEALAESHNQLLRKILDGITDTFNGLKPEGYDEFDAAVDSWWQEKVLKPLDYAFNGSETGETTFDHWREILIGEAKERTSTPIFSGLKSIFEATPPPEEFAPAREAYLADRQVIEASVSDVDDKVTSVENHVTTMEGDVAEVKGDVEAVSQSLAEATESLRLEMDALSGTPGYIAVVQSRNIEVSGYDTYSSTLPFDLQDGVAVGASTAYSGVNLEKPGVWFVHGHVRARETSRAKAILADDVSSIRLQTTLLKRSENGGYIQVLGGVNDYYFESAHGGEASTVPFTLSVLVPPDHSVGVLVYAAAGRRRYFDGGKKWSSLVAWLPKESDPGSSAPATVSDA